MNFTREPITETIITPKEGFKLLVRNSKGGGQEEYHVDSVEVVSFGHSFFFRSLEKPKSFLVPVSDYEIVEVKEVRVALKNASVERAIKIGGGREGPMRSSAREHAAERAEAAPVAQEGEASEEEAQSGSGQPRQPERRRDRHRRRRRRGERPEGGEGAERGQNEGEPREATQPEAAVEGGGTSEETQVSSSMFTTLFPPPSTLISETISRYKEKDLELSERGVLPKPVDEEEKPTEKKHDDEDDDNTSGGEGNQLSRVVTTSSTASFGETSFTAFTPPSFGGDF